MTGRTAPWAALAIVIAMLTMPVSAGAYTVSLRWTNRDDPNVAGYHLYVRPADGPERPPIDIPRPRHDGSGRFEGLIGDLEVEKTYTFELSSYSADGTESDRSNSHTIGYEQASTVVDSDHDGLTDAEEDRNKNQRVDPGETNRLVADSDSDGVPDGAELELGSDPLDPNSPSCRPLTYSEFRVVGSGTANVGFDAELNDLAVATTPGGPSPTSIGVTYPQYGKGNVTEPLFVTRVRDNDPFRIEIRARSIEGKLYRLRYEGHGRLNRMTKRRLRRSLGDHFTGERYELIGIDVAADIARMDPTALFDHIERITMRGSFVMEQPRVCD
jgi:thrombospondin type 3 repeat protein